MTAASQLQGAAHEIFAECVDDVQGAVNFARRQGVKKIFLIGHSTGCQKSVYWAHKKKGRGIAGIVLLAPVSDYAAACARHGRAKVARAALAARALVRHGKKYSLLPEGIWHEVVDAQRFLSLYTPESVEEIFSYAQPKKNPRVLRSVQVPMLVLWPEKDEFAKRPAEITAWLEKHIWKGRVVTVPRVKHNFRGGEKFVAATIRLWIQSVSS